MESAVESVPRSAGSVPAHIEKPVRPAPVEVATSSRPRKRFLILGPWFWRRCFWPGSGPS